MAGFSGFALSCSFRVSGVGFADITVMMENHMEKNMDNKMDTGNLVGAV